MSDALLSAPAMGQTLLIDLGNTRIKWRFGNGPTFAAATLEECFAALSSSAAPAQVLACVVGAEARYQAVRDYCRHTWQIEPQRLQVSRNALGVHNHYDDLSQQGCDRWAAVLGARAQFPAQTLLIVSAGTALVVDTLTQDGQYLGGTISPGLGLMKQALFQGTAKLPLADGQHQDFPRNTHDAITTGCLRAIKGIILESMDTLAQQHIPIDQILLFGGDAAAIHSLLNGKAKTVDNLVLDGLYALHCAAEGVFTQ
ncbi:type III pantothenate kinase [Chitinibacter sp. SCUT-21]|uniref:type III pantothenate kinase n=1 Tax=Chitinibacter sp. SCUT-21 TaxID=2970891 RepID=UPI0035A5F57B